MVNVRSACFSSSPGDLPELLSFHRVQHSHWIVAQLRKDLPQMQQGILGCQWRREPAQKTSPRLGNIKGQHLGARFAGLLEGGSPLCRFAPPRPLVGGVTWIMLPSRAQSNRGGIYLPSYGGHCLKMDEQAFGLQQGSNAG